MGFLLRWFGRYWRWTWPLVAIITFLVWKIATITWWTAPDTTGLDTSNTGGFLFFLLGSIAIIGIYRWWNGVMPPIWIAVAMICIPLFLWGVWVINPEWYDEWRRSRFFLWTIITAFVLGWLSSYTGPVAKVARAGLVLLVLISMGIGTYSAYTRWAGKTPSQPQTPETPAPVVTSIDNLPAKIVLPIIAECESGGQQFEADGGVTPKQTAGSSAIGKYQILEDTHKEELEKLGLDVRTEEGNEEFARILYNREGFGPWEASRACWELELVARGLSSSPTTNTTFALVVGREWSAPVSVPLGQNLLWERVETVAFEAQTQTGEIYQFPRELPKEHTRISGRLTSLKFRVTDRSAESVIIQLVLSPLQ